MADRPAPRLADSFVCCGSGTLITTKGCFLCISIRWFREKYLKNSGTYSLYTKWRIYVWKGLSLVISLISNTGWWLNLFSLKWVLFHICTFIRWFRGKYSKNSGTHSFYKKWRIYVWKGLSLIVLLISKTGRWWNFFKFKVSFVSYVLLYTDLEKNTQQIPARTVLKQN